MSVAVHRAARLGVAILILTACTGRQTDTQDTGTPECPIGPGETVVQCFGNECLSSEPMPSQLSLQRLLSRHGWDEPEPDWDEEGGRISVSECTLDGQRIVRVGDTFEFQAHIYRQGSDGAWRQVSYRDSSDSTIFCGCSFAKVWGEHFCGPETCDWERVGWGTEL